MSPRSSPTRWPSWRSCSLSNSFWCSLLNDMPPVGASAPLRVDIAEKTFRSAEGVSLTALRDLSFEVRQGEFACLLGPSGCGKTTTLRILLGLDKEFSGSFQLPKGGSNRVAAVFQEPILLPWRTV